MEKIIQKHEKTIMFMVIAWVAYAVFYVYAQHLESIRIYASIIETAILLGANFIAIVYAFWLWTKTKGDQRQVFSFFTISMILVFIDSALYNICYNVLHVVHGQAPVLLISVDNIAYLGYLVFQFLFWTAILFLGNFFKNTSHKLILYFPMAIIAITLVLLSVLAIKLNAGQLSLMGFYDTADKIFEIANLIGIVLCLAASRNRGLFYIALSFLIDTAFSTIMGFNLLSQSYGIGSFLESIWVISWLLKVYGLIVFKRSLAYKEPVSSWIVEPDSLRAQLAFWLFSVGILTLCIFFVILYLSIPRIFF